MPRKKKGLEDFNLKPFFIKSMLDAVERSNGGRDRLNFKDLCDKQPFLFGAIGSERRQQYQADWGTIKKRSFKDYVALLDECEVLPGINTANQIQRLGDSIDDMSSTENKDEMSATTDTTETGSESKDTKPSAKPTAKTTPPRTRTPPPPPSLRSPPMARGSSRTPPRSKQNVAVDLDFENLHIDDDEEAEEEHPLCIGDGTEENPFVFVFKSEGTHPFGFFARIKLNKKVGRRGRRVLEIIKSVGADADHWTAKTVMDGDYAYRAVKLSGPPLNYWLIKYLEELTDDPDDPNSKMDAQAFLTTYAHNGEKKIHYMMVIEDEDVFLDNHAISSDDTEILRNFKRLDGKPPLFKGKQLHNVVAKWEVAIFDSGDKKILEKDKNASAMDLF